MDEMNLRDILIAKLALEEALGSQINELITAESATLTSRC